MDNGIRPTFLSTKRKPDDVSAWRNRKTAVALLERRQFDEQWTFAVRETNVSSWPNPDRQTDSTRP